MQGGSGKQTQIKEKKKKRGKEEYWASRGVGECRCSSYLQEAVPAAKEVSSLHDAIGGEDQLVLAERRLVWAAVDRLSGPRREIHRTLDFEETHTETNTCTTAAKTGNIICNDNLT